MPGKYFSVENSSSLDSLPAGGKIHIVGVCGVAMAQMAVALCERGFTVSGSDRNFYEPMGSYLGDHPIALHRGYREENVPRDVSLVVIANAMFPDNPEVRIVEKMGLAYTSFPQLLAELIIGDRDSIVVCGTHGKTTTTALIASVLHKTGLSPSYFIGGICEDLPRSLAIGKGDFSVVEGDEYHSAFYAKIPKFHFYRAKTVLLNSLEFDHADIYSSVDEIVEEFRRLLASLPSEGRIICCSDYPLVRKLSDSAGESAVTYGHSVDSHYCLKDRKTSSTGQLITIESRARGSFEIQVPMLGEYNAMNALACTAVLLENGLELELIQEHMMDFKAVKRRQEVKFDREGLILIEDFAHHPTAVKGTVRAIREAYPRKRLWAVFEARSNTSRKRIFQRDYETAFEEADEVILAKVNSSSRMDETDDLIDIEELAGLIRARGSRCRALSSPDGIETSLLSDVDTNDVVLLMSNGSFGGLSRKLTEGFSKRFH